MNEYMAIFQSFPSDCGITYNDFLLKGYTIFVTNLCPDMNVEVTQSQRQKNLRLEMKFAEPLKENVSVINMAICDGMVQINQDLRVSLS